MGGLRSWLGSFLSLALFFIVRRWTTGFALPGFVGIIFGCTYIWFVVLRVPELRKVTASVPTGPRTDANGADTKTPPPSTTRAPVNAGDASEPSDAVDKNIDAAAATVPVVDALPCQGTEQRAVPVSSEQTRASEYAGADRGSVAAQVSVGGGAADEDNGPVVTTPAVAPAADEEAAAAAAAAASAAAAPSDTAPVASVIEEAHRDASEEARTDAEADEPTPALPDPDQAPEGEDGSEDSFSEDDENAQDADQHFDAERSQELRLEGNEHFKAGRLYDAREAYSEALHLAPPGDAKGKAVLFSNRAACQQKLQRWDDMVADCKQAIELDPEFVKPYSRRSIAFEQLGRWHDAHEDLKKAVELDPSLRSKEYKRMAFLESRAKEQFEKDKEEMVTKLKDLGNTVLGKFGMSCDNFKMEQDPNTGSYSIKFQQ